MAFEGAGKVAGLEIWRIEVIYTLLYIFYLVKKLDSTEKRAKFPELFMFANKNLALLNFPISYMYKNTSLAFWLNF